MRRRATLRSEATGAAHLPAFRRLLAAALVSVAAAGLLDVAALSATQGRPVATYSIVARDSATGQIGVAVQSHWFSVGSLVPWAEAGVGAVATQSFVEPAFGAAGLSLMRSGRSAPDALRRLLTADPGVETRQVAMIDARGRVAVYTGSRSIPYAGHRTGPQFSVQANLMDRPDVWTAMARAYETSVGDLADRMLAALAAAERAGGDARGRQSAAIIVVAARPTGRPWDDRIVDLRVEDHADPVGELRRLVGISRAYRSLAEGDGRLARGQLPQALQAYERAVSSAPDTATNGEVAFWAGIRLVAAGQESMGLTYLRRAQSVHSRWIEVMRRLPVSGVLPANNALIQRLERGMTSGR
jgi:uncharacterized Ntn-hydrolase superfamily protein